MPTKPTKPTKPNTHGGRREGSGRKRIDQAEPTVVFPVRMPRSLRDKLLELGGGEWIREKIRRAKVKSRHHQPIRRANSAISSRVSAAQGSRASSAAP